MNTPQAQAGRVLAVSDGRAGNARQAQALAAALSPLAGTLELQPRAPWRWLAPRRFPGDGGGFGPAFAMQLAAAPSLAVGCGRQAALATRILRARGTRVVQVLDPRLPTRHWDLVVAPAHDGLQGANVITMAGSLHPVDDDWLARARADFPALGALPSPRIAVLVGGPSTHADLDAADLDALMATAESIAAAEGGSLLATTSRRTPAPVRAALHRRAAMDVPSSPAHAGQVPMLAWTVDAKSVNPYAGILAWADRIVCTPDSVNMLSEACATRAPVYVHRPDALRGRPRSFIDDLLARGRIRPFSAHALPFEAEPLRETARVAAEVRARLGMPAPAPAPAPKADAAD